MGHAAAPEADAKKKSRHAAEQVRPDVQTRRAEWPASVSGVRVEQLVFLDETGAKTNMTRLHGRCPRGERLVEKAPHGHWRTRTLLTAVRAGGPFAAMVFDGPVNRPTFVGYVEEVLAPALKPGDVVVRDNLAAHKSALVAAAVERAGARVLYLPPYSPDLNPIENMFSKVKQHLRQIAARTFATLVDAVASALNAVTAQDCLGYFAHCGYNAI